MSKILVLYGTTEGHTATIAASIGGALTGLGFEVDVVQAGTLDPQPSAFDGVIVAASLHAGRYQKAVRRWIRAHCSELNAKPTAFVSVCLAAASKRPAAIAEVDAIITRFAQQVGWTPTITKAVAGALLYTKYNVFIRWFMKRIAAAEGGDTDTSRDYDYTDWNALRAFAGEFGRRVTAAASDRSSSSGDERIRAAAGPAAAVPNRPRIAIGPLLGAILIAMSAAVASGQTSSEPEGRFVAEARDYAQMHRRLERQIGSIEITTPVDEINRIVQQLVAAIRRERRDAKQGDFFAPDLAPGLRARIDAALRANDLSAGDIVSASRVDGIDYLRLALRVNDTFPWVLGVAMFPCLIEALPPLPPELQYRVVGTDLLLIDVHASLIVDILPSALVDSTVQ